MQRDTLDMGLQVPQHKFHPLQSENIAAQTSSSFHRSVEKRGRLQICWSSIIVARNSAAHRLLADCAHTRLANGTKSVKGAGEMLVQWVLSSTAVSNLVFLALLVKRIVLIRTLEGPFFATFGLEFGSAAIPGPTIQRLYLTLQENPPLRAQGKEPRAPKTDSSVDSPHCLPILPNFHLLLRHPPRLGLSTPTLEFRPRIVHYQHYLGIYCEALALQQSSAQLR
ncbi:hypothetical protein BT96DRAFT_1001957 [Gymnopus androsaceus JB14]|uniref:Uncharacterized protein n=1 Tax=Gymnopus androsaceus JB14 TaxID=1447944 RepID=A0A6A4GY48_9AGAR|nr:hypothetical protein BT96DRAFT_1001957 [Gymnopus androsaceus JB14]